MNTGAHPFLSSRRGRAAAPAAIRWLLSAAAGFAVSFPAAADTLSSQNRTVTGVVERITEQNIALKDGTSMGRTDEVHIVFDAGPVVAKPQGIVLIDGSVLSGVVRSVGPGEIRFRSTSLGLLALPLSRVAAMYQGAPPLTKEIRTGRNGRPRIVRRTGEDMEGDLFAGAAGHVVLRTERGMEKVAWENLAFVALNPAQDAPALFLRNGDRIALPVRWQGTDFAVELPDNRTITLSIGALAQARLPAKPEFQAETKDPTPNAEQHKPTEGRAL